MKRAFLTLTLLVLLMPGLAMPALARGDGWQPFSAGIPSTWPCPTPTGVTSITVTSVVKEFIKVLRVSDGTTEYLVTGSGKVHLVAPNGTTLDINNSGPGRFTLYPNKDLEFSATGRNVLFLTPDVAAATGIPTLASLSGPFDLVFKADGSVVAKRIPNVVRDLCAQLT
jgi:hypothetical protein